MAAAVIERAPRGVVALLVSAALWVVAALASPYAAPHLAGCVPSC